MTPLEHVWKATPVWLALALSAGAVVAGDYFAKRWSIDRGANRYWIAVVFYLLAAQLYLPTLLKEGLVITSLIWSLLSTIGFLFVGLVVFKETLTGLQMVGVALGLVAMVILAIGDLGGK